VTADTISIDESAPMPVKRPATVAELCDIVTAARAAGQGVYPVGGRTTLDVGLPPTKPGVAVDTTALNRVIDYPARDMTITAQAGITIAALQAELAKEHQWLPVDVAGPERATLGGAIALNQSGPRRYGYGTLRDYVIGISFVTDDGVEVKAGGRVVKNVAGYDLMKLQIGAVGTLGVVSQVTLKVKPRPEAAAWVTLGCAPEALGSVLNLVHASRSRPSAVCLSDKATAYTRTPWWLGVAFHEKRATVDWQVATFLEELGGAAVQNVVHHPAIDLDDVLGWETRMLVGELHPGDQSRFGFKASVLPSRAAAFCNAVLGLPVSGVVACPLNGVVHGHVTHDLPRDEAAAMVDRLTALATAGGGTVTVVRCPAAWKKSLPVWGKPTAAWDLMRHVKTALDPDDVFNPGRLFGAV